MIFEELSNTSSRFVLRSLGAELGAPGYVGSPSADHGSFGALAWRGLRAELGIPNEFRYFGTTGGTFRYRNTEHNIGTDTDTEWIIPNDFFGTFEFPAPTNIPSKYTYMSSRNIRHHTNNACQVLPLSVRNCSSLLCNKEFLFCNDWIYKVLLPIFLPAGSKMLRNNKINALEALKYIWRLGIGFIWAQEYIKRHLRWF